MTNRVLIRQLRLALAAGLIGMAHAAEGLIGTNSLPPLPPPPPSARPIIRVLTTNAPAFITNRTPSGMRQSTPLRAYQGQPGTRAPRPAQTPLQTYGPTAPVVDPVQIPGLNPLPPTEPLPPYAPRTTVPRVVYQPPPRENVFAWDALVKEATLKPGQVTNSFTFSLTNTSNAEVTINGVRTSCGCTVAKLPAVPWGIPAGGSGTFDVDVDLRGKSGIVTKTITIDSTAGYRYLTVRVSIPASASAAAMSLSERARNLQIALADRQAVFKGDCAACHLQPAMGQTGEALYFDACGVCHEAEHRASMVPNLRALNKPADREYWRTWITRGKAGTLMPAWAINEGGPLTEAQIASLLDYLTGPFTVNPAPDHGTGSAGQTAGP